MSSDDEKHTDCDVKLKLWVRNEYAPTIERLIRLEEKHEGSLKALSLQATEYERRLDLLNHAHVKHEQFANSFLTEELFRAYRDSVMVKFDHIHKELAELRGSSSGKTSIRHLVFETITLLIAGAAVLFAVLS